MFLRRIITVIILSAGMCFFVKDGYGDSCPISGMADFCGAAGDEVGGQYIITFKKVELSTDGVNFITVGESSGTQINIAGMDVGSSFQNFATNTNIPAGTYHYLRLTISRTFSLKGRGQKNGGAYYYTSQATGTSPNPPYFPIAASCATWNNGQPGGGCLSYGAVSIQMPDDAVNHSAPGETMEFVNNNEDVRITKTLSSPIVITADTPSTIQMKFYTQGMIGFSGSGSNYVVFPMPPVQDLDY